MLNDEVSLHSKGLGFRGYNASTVQFLPHVTPILPSSAAPFPSQNPIPGTDICCCTRHPSETLCIAFSGPILTLFSITVFWYVEMQSPNL